MSQQLPEGDPIEQARADGYAAALVEIKRLNDRVSELVTTLDKQLGTPCEQVRHQAEIDRLHSLLKQISARAQAIPGDDLKELQRQMMHIKSLATY